MPYWRCWCGDAFYTDTLLQTDDVTHSSLTQRDTETFVHREAFTHRDFYAKRLLHTEVGSLAEPALLLFEFLSVSLLPLPDHLPFVFPFPSLKSVKMCNGYLGTESCPPGSGIVLLRANPPVCPHLRRRRPRK